MFARTPEEAMKAGIEVYVEHEVLSLNVEKQEVTVKSDFFVNCMTIKKGSNVDFGH